MEPADLARGGDLQETLGACGEKIHPTVVESAGCVKLCRTRSQRHASTEGISGGKDPKAGRSEACEQLGTILVAGNGAKARQHRFREGTGTFNRCIRGATLVQKKAQQRRATGTLLERG